ncbi:uncharacterized protein LOC131034893 [Cryptomeria japonica]|uniref:uncharacterized protein LOC131034893 n=1 Tax=Cryptomeria japonica TaxID=3369 RepID=UPI0025ABF3D3|nr:uncharacterized protein LOC131034893 [Cryptomeria japonica]
MGRDWAPEIVGTILFVVLSPGLLFQLAAKGRFIEFGNFQTSGLSIFIHTIIFFALITIILIAIGLYIVIGSA